MKYRVPQKQFSEWLRGYLLDLADPDGYIRATFSPNDPAFLSKWRSLWFVKFPYRDDLVPVNPRMDEIRTDRRYQLVVVYIEPNSSKDDVSAAILKIEPDSDHHCYVTLVANYGRESHQIERLVKRIAWEFLDCVIDSSDEVSDDSLQETVPEQQPTVAASGEQLTDEAVGDERGDDEILAEIEQCRTAIENDDDLLYSVQEYDAVIKYATQRRNRQAMPESKRPRVFSIAAAAKESGVSENEFRIASRWFANNEYIPSELYPYAAK